MTTKVGLVGCGRWGKHILRDLKTLGCAVHVAALSDTSVANAHAHGADSVVSKVTEINEHLDGYVIASPTIDHLDAVEFLLPQGRPIFVEKPLTDDIQRAKRLPSSAADLIFVMHKWRYHPGVEALRSIKQAEEFGPVTGLHSRRVQWLQPHQDVDAIWILAPHDLSIATHIFGSVPEACTAWIDPVGCSGDGLHAKLADRATSAPISLEVSSSQPYTSRMITVGFDQAIVTLTDKNYQNLEIRLRSGTSDTYVINRPLENHLPLFLELEAFVQHLQGGSRPFTAYTEEIKMLDVLVELRSMAGLNPDGQKNC